MNRRPPVPVDYGGVGEALGPFPPGLNTEGLAPGRGLSVFEGIFHSIHMLPDSWRALYGWTVPLQGDYRLKS